MTTPEDAARAIARPVGDLGGAFMLDGATYAKGAELGFSGIDFYVLGRGGALGDTSADVVASAFLYWNPGHVATQWEAGRAVMSPADGAAAWADVCHTYGDTNLPDVDGLDRLGVLAGKVVAETSPAGAPLFAGWRTLAVPGADRPRARAQHLLNALRELRGGLHGGAVLAAGLSPIEAVAVNAPGMAPIFGWDPDSLPDGAVAAERWKVAETGTDVAMGRVLSVLDDTERAELVELVTGLHSAWLKSKEG
ncbi:SCO6745 family protein [Rhabdothermincola salaria]|uniref:SCO6745 family protein n=1 Tax=Rhabdothermincola salaria TaxID=2903142 RepID=UPI001E43EB0F|nr:hypothetical protein [Rhabdothermincola salaria]MCD9625188.1 hypothetical protein [Rhabdothermincola salaria]